MHGWGRFMMPGDVVRRKLFRGAWCRYAKRKRLGLELDALFIQVEGSEDHSVTV